MKFYLLSLGLLKFEKLAAETSKERSCSGVLSKRADINAHAATLVPSLLSLV